MRGTLFCASCWRPVARRRAPAAVLPDGGGALTTRRRRRRRWQLDRAGLRLRAHRVDAVSRRSGHARDHQGRRLRVAVVGHHRSDDRHRDRQERADDRRVVLARVSGRSDHRPGVADLTEPRRLVQRPVVRAGGELGQTGDDILVGTRNSDGKVFRVDPMTGQITQVGDMGASYSSSGDRSRSMASARCRRSRKQWRHAREARAEFVRGDADRQRHRVLPAVGHRVLEEQDLRLRQHRRVRADRRRVRCRHDGHPDGSGVVGRRRHDARAGRSVVYGVVGMCARYLRTLVRPHCARP